MDGTKLITVFLLSNFLFGNAVVQEETLSIKEGSKATFTCSGNAVESVWYVSWVILEKNVSRTEIATCDIDNAEKKDTRTEKTCNECKIFQGTSQCYQRTNISGNRFQSQLTIQDVTAKFRAIIIQCIMGDYKYYKSDDIFIMSSYRLSLYYISDHAECDATKDDNNVIKVSCRLAKVYPKFTFRIFPELQSNISNNDTASNFTNLPELRNVTFINYRLPGTTEYYDAYCTFKCYTVQNGTFRFRAGIFLTQNSTNPVINIITNSITVTSIPVGLITGNKIITASSAPVGFIIENKKQNASTANMRNLLLGSILALGVTSFMILSWAICTKRCTWKSSSSTVNSGNEYESIQYFSQNEGNRGVHVSDEGFGESSALESVFSDFSNGDITSLQRNEMRGYVPNIPVYSPDLAAEGGRVCGEEIYIEPTTPTSTLNRSQEKGSFLEQSFHEDTCGQTFVKSVM